MKQGSQIDSIHIRRLRLQCHIGTTARERRKKQTIVADITLKCDLRRAGRSDCLADTIDYAATAKAVAIMATRETFCLLEALAERTTEICLANPAVKEVIVKAGKPGILHNKCCAEIEIRRGRMN